MTSIERLKQLAGLIKESPLAGGWSADNERMPPGWEGSGFNHVVIEDIAEELRSIALSFSHQGATDEDVQALKALSSRLAQAVTDLEKEHSDRNTFSQMEDELLNKDTLGEPKF